MSQFEDALIEAVQWLSIPGVENIIPNEADQSIMVLTSCSSLLLSELIPEQFMGFNVIFYYVHGLNVNAQHCEKVDSQLDIKK